MASGTTPFFAVVLIISENDCRFNPTLTKLLSNSLEFFFFLEHFCIVYCYFTKKNPSKTFVFTSYFFYHFPCFVSSALLWLFQIDFYCFLYFCSLSNVSFFKKFLNPKVFIIIIQCRSSPMGRGPGPPNFFIQNFFLKSATFFVISTSFKNLWMNWFV